MIRIKSPKKYPVYAELIKSGIKPGKARKMIEDAVNQPRSRVNPETNTIAAFCIWAETLYGNDWHKATIAQIRRNCEEAFNA